MSSDNTFKLLDLPSDVLQVLVDHFHNFGTVLRRKDMADIKSAILPICKNKALYRLYIQLFEGSITNIDFRSPFSDPKWNTSPWDLLEAPVLRLNSFLELDCNATWELRKSFSQLLQFIIERIGETLQVIRLPLIPGAQADILRCLLYNCPNLTEIETSHGLQKKNSTYLARLLYNSRKLKKFVISSPTGEIIRALKTTDAQLNHLQVARLQWHDLPAFLDVVISHRFSLKSLIIDRIVWQDSTDPERDHVYHARKTIQAERVLMSFLLNPNGVQLPVLNYLKVACLGFSELRMPSCLAYEMALKQKFEGRATVETDLCANGSSQVGSPSVYHLYFESFISAFNEQKTASRVLDPGYYRDEERCPNEERDGEWPLSDDEDNPVAEAFPANLEISQSAQIFGNIDAYRNLQSASVETSSAVSLFHYSKMFRSQLRQIWKTARHSMTHLLCENLPMLARPVTYSKLCRFLQCCLFYCKKITHLRIPSVLVEYLHLSEDIPNSNCFKMVLQRTSKVQYLQLSTSFVNSNRIRPFLQNWPLFLNEVGTHMKRLRHISFVIPNSLPLAISRDIRDDLRVAANATREFERKYPNIELQEVKLQFDMWFNLINVKNSSASNYRRYS
ncbi:hypothetical protein BWQ96_09645 [Gracilariopsis chorda]|uniref:Uncharacterized protein n=1 Tax=Gracilariopsis chorda TaxID=448386 RepID=A0A2V3IEX6_9FLOR|nr:hypothetical protein BWQ96_09645 [Gracilariopsis chorda]|eukprot:PXF40639.1 hypothetical protein BWQ96_09645 [Gracilariopsis chorda]